MTKPIQNNEIQQDTPCKQLARELVDGVGNEDPAVNFQKIKDLSLKCAENLSEESANCQKFALKLFDGMIFGTSSAEDVLETVHLGIQCKK